jgi:hypothetical protein
MLVPRRNRSRPQENPKGTQSAPREGLGEGRELVLLEPGRPLGEGPEPVPPEAGGRVPGGSLKRGA